MNYSDTRFTLDVQLHQAQVSVSATLNDTARRLCIGLTDGRKPYIIADGCTATFAAKKPDGLALYNPCTIENNTIIYEFTPQTTNVVGTYECEIRLYNAAEKQLTSPIFLLVVDEQAINDDDIIDSFNEVAMLTQIISNETERIGNETDREQAESARVEAESKRVEAESKRVGTEINRQTTFENNEEERKKAFESAETNRQTTFANNEEGRSKAFESAEAERAEAETQRQQYYEDMDECLRGIEDIQNGYISETSNDIALVALNRVYPIGSIYMSVNDTNPAQLFGGTWERLKDMFLLGAGDSYTAGATGGSATHSHTHDLWADIYMIGDGTEHRPNGIMLMKGKTHEGNPTYFDYYLQDNGSLKRVDKTNSNANYKHGTNVGGTIGASSNLPPYLAVYMWKRIA